MILSYWTLFFLDFVVWLICLGLMMRYGGLTVLHPASLYLFFHLYTFSFRLFQLANGAPTLFETWGFEYLPVTQEEIQSASLVVLGALITMTAVWLYWSHKTRLRSLARFNDSKYRPFSKRLMWMVTSVTLPVGILALIFLRGPVLAGSSELSMGEWSGSSYLISIYQWFGISLLVLIFYYGFRRIVLLPLLIYLVVGLLSFPARGMVVVPGLFVVFTYFRRNSVQLLPFRLVVPIVAIVILFIAGKGFGPLLRQGDFAGARNMLLDRVVDMRSGTHGDAMFMDMLAVALTQIDNRGSFYYGGTYAGILVMPIPRPLWPNKPGLADWQKEIQSPGRQTGQMGMIVTAHGEAYANFGYPGIILYSATLATLLHLLYEWMLRAPYYSLVNFWSLCVYSFLIQVFRDGFISFISFQVSMLMPLTIITVLHILFLRRRYRYGGIFTGWSTIFDRYGFYLDAQGTAHYHIYRYR